MSNINILLIDLENCPTQIQQVLEHLDQYQRVIICYAHSQAKVPLSWLNALAQAIQQDKLKIIQMAQAGKNSADFGLCFFAGMLAQEMPENSHFVILSNDTDLDHTIRLLHSQNHRAERIGSLKEKESLAEPEKNARPTENPIPRLDDDMTTRLMRIVGNLLKYSNRPATMQSLFNSIHSHMGQDVQKTEQAYKTLMLNGLISTNDTKIVYHDQKMTQFLKAAL